MNIIFVTAADLPEGAGNTSRLKTLVQCLTASGHNVRIWNKYALGESPEHLLAEKGEVGGAPYEYVLGSTQRVYGFRTVFMKMRSVAAILRRLRRERESIDVVWMNGLSFHDIMPIAAVAKSLGIRTIQSYEDEHNVLCSAGVGLVRRIVIGLDCWLADRLLARRADAIVVISDYLRRKYERLGCKRVFLVPTIVDCDMWRCPPRAPSSRLAFLYSGHFKDDYEFENLIKAFSVLRREEYVFDVKFVGGNQKNRPYEQAIKTRVRAEGLDDRVRFEGFKPLEQMKHDVCAADVLLCLRRDTPWSRSGFSTKLSEYLASGRLVITSAVGDIPLYLKDGRDALVVPSTGLEDVLTALRRVFELGPGIADIADRGADIARRHFDQRVGMAKTEEILGAVLGVSPPAGLSNPQPR